MAEVGMNIQKKGHGGHSRKKTQRRRFHTAEMLGKPLSTI